VHPSEFDEHRVFAEALGIARVEAGALVRSSYLAAESHTAATGL